MLRIFRSIGTALAGLIVGGILVAVVEWIGHSLYPLPAGLDPTDPEQLRRHIQTLPLAAFVWVVAAHAVGSLAGGAIAAWLAGRAPFVHGLVVGGIFLLGGIANLSAIPHPAWFAVLDLLVYLQSDWIGAWLARPSKGRSLSTALPVASSKRRS